jgi:hypothetical protein
MRVSYACLHISIQVLLLEFDELVGESRILLLEDQDDTDVLLARELAQLFLAGVDIYAARVFMKSKVLELVVGVFGLCDDLFEVAAGATSVTVLLQAKLYFSLNF